MRTRWKRILMGIVTWHLICFGVLAVYPNTVGRIFLNLYTAFFGDIQANYGRFERVATYIGLATVTTIATACVFPVCDRLLRQRTTRRSKIICFAVAEVALLLTLIWSYESAFPFTLNQIGWKLFGPPADIYSFRNLVIHRWIAWQICTTPIVLIAHWLHGRFGTRGGDSRRSGDGPSPGRAS
jgi:hypothetical protein